MSEPRTRLAAYALCVEERSILLCRIAGGYPAAGMWTLPGGGVKFGEDPAATCLRELTEETGLAGTIDDLAFVHSGAGVSPPERGGQRWHAVRIVYRVAITDGELRDEIDESTDHAAWIAIDRVGELRLVELAEAALRFVERNRQSTVK